MKIVYNIISLSLSLVLFTSCSQNISSLLILPEYKSQHHIEGASAVIFPDIHIDDIENGSSLNHDLGAGSADSLLRELISKHLPSALIAQSDFETVKLAPIAQDVTLTERHFIVGDDEEATFDLPADSITLAFENIDADYVIFLENLVTYEDYVSYFFTEDETRYLKCYFEYAIWDNHRGRPVAVGIAVASDPVFIIMTSNTWQKMVQQMATLIVKETPFREFSTASTVR